MANVTNLWFIVTWDREMRIHPGALEFSPSSPMCAVKVPSRTSGSSDGNSTITSFRDSTRVGTCTAWGAYETTTYIIWRPISSPLFLNILVKAEENQLCKVWAFCLYMIMDLYEDRISVQPYTALVVTSLLRGWTHLHCWSVVPLV